MLVSIGIIGWWMNVLGNPQATYQTKNRPYRELRKEENVIFMPMVLEETHELVNH
jgi:hypothetical protein